MDAVGVDDVVVAVGHVDIARSEDGIHHRQRVGLERVAGVQDGDQLTRRRGKRVAAGGNGAAAARAPQYPHARVLGGRLGEHRGDPRGGGAVVDDHMLPASERLRSHRFQACPEVGALWVADGREYREAWRHSVRHAAQRTPAPAAPAE